MSCAIPSDAFVIIIGAMKCGTSSLFTQMALHPAICPSVVKEPEFFSRRQGHGHPVQRYEDLWNFDPAVHRYALEGSTGYTKYPIEQGVPQRMVEHGIQPRLIYLMRHPLDRIESQYNFLRTNSRWNLPSITGERMIALSNYHLQLQQYAPFFARERLLLLQFEDLKRRPDQLMAEVFRFLDLEPPATQSPMARENPTQPVSDAVVRLARSPMGAVLRRLPNPVREGGRHLLNLISPPKQHRMTTAQRDTVMKALAPDMARLRAEYGVDVAAWGF